MPRTKWKLSDPEIDAHVFNILRDHQEKKPSDVLTLIKKRMTPCQYPEIEKSMHRLFGDQYAED